ncbi:hypothetical protein [Spirilliplanes yamanashiensis]|uniref:2'-5' RNA ligase n=1 Tax=Spirilliplanes yamanashiensis TaxID=42233 RepID=A0A8J3YB14_9ACTN|nr:hypothetical protein [Spirilliplanes yamanashiensis]MDP9818946.1 2'-5' RNA ligase [Spirilliplanes yamanashiensis]GIJ05401.1 hypothetical protein Sya03_47530 [Spirilliplanes yamanashiensis]
MTGGAGTGPAFGVVLVPPPDVAREMTAYARAAAGDGPVSVLGERRPAHVTLAHARCDAATFAAWWDGVRAAVPATVAVRFSGALVAPVPPGDTYVPQGGTYVGLEAVRRPELELAHRVVLGLAAGLGAAPMGAVGDDFRPHVTLAVLGRGVTVTLPPVPPDLVAGPVALRLAAGPLGEYGTFPDLRLA